MQWRLRRTTLISLLFVMFFSSPFSLVFGGGGRVRVMDFQKFLSRLYCAVCGVGGGVMEMGVGWDWVGSDRGFFCLEGRLIGLLEIYLWAGEGRDPVMFD